MAFNAVFDISLKRTKNQQGSGDAVMLVILRECECIIDILCACPCGDRDRQTETNKQRHSLRAGGLDTEAV